MKKTLLNISRQQSANIWNWTWLHMLCLWVYPTLYLVFSLLLMSFARTFKHILIKLYHLIEAPLFDSHEWNTHHNTQQHRHTDTVASIAADFFSLSTNKTWQQSLKVSSRLYQCSILHLLHACSYKLCPHIFFLPQVIVIILLIKISKIITQKNKITYL